QRTRRRIGGAAGPLDGGVVQHRQGNIEIRSTGRIAETHIAAIENDRCATRWIDARARTGNAQLASLEVNRGSIEVIAAVVQSERAGSELGQGQAGVCAVGNQSQIEIRRRVKSKIVTGGAAEAGAGEIERTSLAGDGQRIGPR